jgi:hypothetical protein
LPVSKLRTEARRQEPGEWAFIIVTASGLRYVLSDGIGPPADLVPNRLCQGATVCFGCILTPSPSPSAAEYFHLVVPGPPVLGRMTPEKGHLKKRAFGLGA